VTREKKMHNLSRLPSFDPPRAGQAGRGVTSNASHYSHASHDLAVESEWGRGRIVQRDPAKLA